MLRMMGTHIFLQFFFQYVLLTPTCSNIESASADSSNTISSANEMVVDEAVESAESADEGEEHGVVYSSE